MALGTSDRLVGRTATAERQARRRGVVPARARALDLPVRAMVRLEKLVSFCSVARS